MNREHQRSHISTTGKRLCEGASLAFTWDNSRIIGRQPVSIHDNQSATAGRCHFRVSHLLVCSPFKTTSNRAPHPADLASSRREIVPLEVALFDFARTQLFAESTVFLNAICTNPRWHR